MPANRALLQSIAEAAYATASSIDHLGTGGFACTFKIDLAGDVIAVKVLDPNQLEPGRVERELAALQRVDSPGVVKFRGHRLFAFEGDEYQIIEMDFIEGRSLQSVFNAGEVFAPLEALQLVRGLVEAASSIWAERTAHRDLSPNNILLDAANRPIIVDLGLARHVEDESTMLPTPGTPGWMSPEQVASAPSHGDWRSDQFVIGALAYRLLTNTRPFDHPNAMVRWEMPARHAPAALRSVEPTVPSAVAEVVERMMAKSPVRRYLKVSQLLEDIDSALAVLRSGETTDPADLSYFVNIGQVKNFAEGGFPRELGSGGVIVDIRAKARIAEFVQPARDGSGIGVIDPVTYLVRSPLDVRPAYFQALGYGAGPVLTGFADDDARRAWCQQVLQEVLNYDSDVVLAPYYFAGPGETHWVRESLDSWATFSELMADEDDPRVVWPTVAIHSSWVAEEEARESLLLQLTSIEADTLYLLVNTSQPTFGPIADAAVLAGLRDVIDVLREAGTRVVFGQRASSGLLLLALGGAGWTTGISAVLMNAKPHPEEDDGRKGQPTPRVYVPALLNLITVDAYLLMLRQPSGERLQVSSAEFDAVLVENPELTSLTPEQKILLYRHNLKAQLAQVQELDRLSSGERIATMRSWVDAAVGIYRGLPPQRQLSDGGDFLEAWTEVLS